MLCPVNALEEGSAPRYQPRMGTPLRLLGLSLIGCIAAFAVPELIFTLLIFVPMVGVALFMLWQGR